MLRVSFLLVLDYRQSAKEVYNEVIVQNEWLVKSDAEAEKAERIAEHSFEERMKGT